MNKLTVLLLALALPLLAAGFENVVVRDGDTSFSEGDVGARESSRELQESNAGFRRGRRSSPNSRGVAKRR